MVNGTVKKKLCAVLLDKILKRAKKSEKQIKDHFVESVKAKLV